ncbi:MAG TPA: 4Fe-4S binding protein, partial [Syntrophales bacterium]|nr:4Fe-4S binding protein [Syntrophales bacterium]HLA28046.1 4Fe-4S binding protein [Syntrophales bacterium]
KKPKKAPSVKIIIDPDRCEKCTDCVFICPVGVYETGKGGIVIAGPEFCCGKTCKQCVIFCHKKAIAIV